MPSVSAVDLKFDVLLLTHDHGDLLDIDSFVALMNVIPQCEIVAPRCCDPCLSKNTDRINASVMAKRLVTRILT